MKTWKSSNDPESKKANPVAVRQSTQGRVNDLSGRIRITIDSVIFGSWWFVNVSPAGLQATYHRMHGVRPLLAALDLKFDKMYGHVSNSKKHQDILHFLRVQRHRYHRSQRLYIILDNFSPHKHERVRNWSRITWNWSTLRHTHRGSIG